MTSVGSVSVDVARLAHVDRDDPASGNGSILKNILAALTADPILDMLLAAALTFAAHSSVAVMLLLAGLSAGHVVTPVAAIALVLGANLGGALSVLRDLNRVNSHLATIGYAVTSSVTPSHSDRLVSPPEEVE